MSITFHYQIILVLSVITSHLAACGGDRWLLVSLAGGGTDNGENGGKFQD